MCPNQIRITQVCSLLEYVCSRSLEELYQKNLVCFLYSISVHQVRVSILSDMEPKIYSSGLKYLLVTFQTSSQKERCSDLCIP